MLILLLVLIVTHPAWYKAITLETTWLISNFCFNGRSHGYFSFRGFLILDFMRFIMSSIIMCVSVRCTSTFLITQHHHTLSILTLNIFSVAQLVKPHACLASPLLLCLLLCVKHTVVMLSWYIASVIGGVLEWSHGFLLSEANPLMII